MSQPHADQPPRIHCANSPCPGLARWQLHTAGPTPEPPIYSCSDCIGTLLDDQTSTWITPISPLQEEPRP